MKMVLVVLSLAIILQKYGTFYQLRVHKLQTFTFLKSRWRHLFKDMTHSQSSDCSMFIDVLLVTLSYCFGRLPQKSG